jgi:hypothetical protein
MAVPPAPLDVVVTALVVPPLSVDELHAATSAPTSMAPAIVEARGIEPLQNGHAASFAFT